MQAKDYALHMMRTTGSVPPTVIAVMFSKEQVRQLKLPPPKTFGPAEPPEGE